MEMGIADLDSRLFGLYDIKAVFIIIPDTSSSKIHSPRDVQHSVNNKCAQLAGGMGASSA